MGRTRLGTEDPQRNLSSLVPVVEESSAVKEAQISVAVRSLRAEYAKWLLRVLPKEKVAFDCTGEILQLVEDDWLCEQVQKHSHPL